MLVKIPSISSYLGEEEDAVIPISVKGYYVLTVNFWEDVPNGRKARFVVVRDNFGILHVGKSFLVKGKKTVVQAEGVKEAWDVISRRVKIERPLTTNRVPLLYDIELTDETQSRGIRGFINYVKKYGMPNVDGISVDFEVKELV
ncbi:hypothetical protein [Sulfuracidifex tepidarius]|uniref:Uncharacterized protein n=1 Tax=Sulfuracidifex tepidarius TaxID=1294262 RepID=A0A510DRW5_9CREN|nr:hypothetical protein [Sulfuracidifex tepidarius]BBG22894.1 hypothetical protein IC006_0178 [Sulfuracidifex tepidarius]BBG25655.1 hypothetical protein IC007_0160 [Sulfuracidifex tepidarius]